MINRLTNGLNLQTQALALRGDRQRLIASNIANADTPGYVARDFNFPQALREATSGLVPSFKLAENKGLPRAGEGVGPDEGGPPSLTYSAASQTNLDSNTVDMDRERATFVDNGLKYESTLRFINASVKVTLDSMKAYNQA
jgi:flagellar basal-body rod protein FlgB